MMCVQYTPQERHRLQRTCMPGITKHAPALCCHVRPAATAPYQGLPTSVRASHRRTSSTREALSFLSRKPVGQIIYQVCRRLVILSGAVGGVLHLQKTCSKEACSLAGSSRLLAGTGFSSFPSLLDIRMGCCASSMLSTQYCRAHGFLALMIFPLSSWNACTDAILEQSAGNDVTISKGHLHLRNVCGGQLF
jgi:hypothetical protein